MREKKEARFLILLFIFIFAIILWFMTTNPYLRYFINLPLGSLILALIMDKMLEWINGKIKHSIIWSLFLVIPGTNFVCQLATVNVASPYPLKDAIFHTYERSGYWQDVKKVFDFAAIKYGRESRGLLIDSWGCILPILM